MRDEGRGAKAELRSLATEERAASTFVVRELSARRAGWRSLLDAFRYAFAGLFYLIKTERNAQIHCAIAAIAVALGFWFQIERAEWLALVLIIALVITAEGFNTAIEAAVDLASPGYHPLAKVAKDVAAGSVLLTAMMSLVVGAIIFLPRLWAIANTLLR
jgi:diacylglycerol kinase (ATP)